MPPYLVLFFFLSPARHTPPQETAPADGCVSNYKQATYAAMRHMMETDKEVLIQQNNMLFFCTYNPDIGFRVSIDGANNLPVVRLSSISFHLFLSISLSLCIHGFLPLGLSRAL